MQNFWKIYSICILVILYQQGYIIKLLQLKYMGQIIQEMQNMGCKQQSPKEAPICMEDYTIVSTVQNGNMIIREEDHSRYYLYHKELQKTSKNIEVMYNWLNSIYNHNFNVVKYEIKSKSFLCASHVSIKVLLEYGDISLYQILNQRSTLMDQDSHNITQLLDSVKYDTPLELLNFIKLMINVVEQQREKNKVWIRFHTKNIVFQRKSKSFKYFHLFDLQENNCTQSFFAPQINQKQASQKQTIFSMGMVLLSLFLKQDCSDCYNYQNHTFCEFIFQEKIQKMKEKMITIGLLGILDDESQYVSQFDEEVSEFILLMTEKQEERLSFAQVKRRYLWLIRKASFSFGVKNEVKSRSILQPLTSKRAQKNKKHTRNKVGCFSTKQQMHFKTTFTEIDDSDFFSISKSNIQSKHQKKCKQNQALKWKKAITKKMKDQKQNLTFNSQH